LAIAPGVIGDWALPANSHTNWGYFKNASSFVAAGFDCPIALIEIKAPGPHPGDNGGLTMAA
jgi:hypothetical protein